MVPSLTGKTFVVAGAAGFVPSHVCQHYLELGAEVIGLDNFLTGTSANIEALKTYPNFTFHRCDVVTDAPALSGSIDFVLSLASPASPADFAKLPVEIMRVNSEGTRNLLELARQKGARFLEASTSEVYGDPDIHPQPESYWGMVNPIGLRACYDESKRFAEALTMSYHRSYQLDTRIVRIFNTYGPRMRADDGRVIPNFITQALAGEDLTIYGDGTQTRSFCYVTDLVAAIDCVLFSDCTEPVNCGNPNEYSIAEVAKMIITVLESSSCLTFCPLPQDDPKQRCPDIGKLRSLGFDPSWIGLEEGIRQTAESLR